MSETIPFWEKPLNELNSKEWEQLCDGCARCCLVKIEDEEDQTLYTTSIACRYLNQEQCSCNCYTDRTIKVPECVQVTLENLPTLWWMPESCSYRLRAQGRPLPQWHPLISGSRETVHEAGISIRYLAILEDQLDEDEMLEDYVIDAVTKLIEP